MRLFLVFSTVFVFGFHQNAYAQGHSLYCSHADSTAASQKCLQRHLDSAQSRLNGVYQELNKTVEGEALDALKELQASWLIYRDAECTWEASLSENLSLKRMNELSCLARITEDRADILAVALNDEEKSGESVETQREYGSFPRWMNVIAKQEPKAYWNYKDRTRFDLDCDGDDEYIMTGAVIRSTNEPDLHTVIYHVAVSENSPIGKPVVKIFNFPVQAMEGEEDISVCSVSPVMSYIAQEKNQKEEEQGSEACTARLVMKSKGCQDQVIYWSGKEYTLEKPIEKPAEILQKEENKKETKKK